MSSNGVQTPVTTEDAVYHVTNGEPLMATIYRPLGPGPFSGVVSVHGGRWCAESRFTNAVIDRAIAASGAVVMAADFRMPPVARYPTPVADINLAIRWLKQRANTYGISLAALGGIGTSSGGHQLLLNALKPEDPRYASWPLPNVEADCPEFDASLAYVVACWPVADPLARYRYALSREMTLHVESHHAYWPDEAAMAEGSPQRIVADREATHLPPILLIQGANDTVLTPDMADRFAAAYIAAGGELDLAKFAGEAHTFITKTPDSESARTAITTICGFIAARFRAAAARIGA